MDMDQMKKEWKDIVASSMADKPTPEKGVTVYNLMDDWFVPKPEIMKHVITVQLIAALLVGMFLIATSVETMSQEGIVAVMTVFLISILGVFGLYGRI